MSEYQYYEFVAIDRPLSPAQQKALRALSLGWLAGVQLEEFDATRHEPRTPPQLQALSAPLKRLPDFIDLDADLLSAAAQGSAAQSALPNRLPDFIAALPEKKKNQYLLDLVTS